MMQIKKIDKNGKMINA